MAKIGIPKEKYIAEIESMLKSWLWIEEITANKLQKVIGGKYSRISELLEEYKKEYMEKMDAKNEVPQSEWYKDIVWNVIDSVSDNLSDMWLIVNNEMVKSTKKVTMEFEEQKNLLEIQKTEDSRQIENLEIEIDELKGEVWNKDVEMDSLKKENSVLSASLNRVESELKGLRSENGELIKKLWVVEWKMLMQDDMIKKLESK